MAFLSQIGQNYDIIDADQGLSATGNGNSVSIQSYNNLFYGIVATTAAASGLTVQAEYNINSGGVDSTGWVAFGPVLSLGASLTNSPGKVDLPVNIGTLMSAIATVQKTTAITSALVRLTFVVTGTVAYSYICLAGPMQAPSTLESNYIFAN